MSKQYDSTDDSVVTGEGRLATASGDEAGVTERLSGAVRRGITVRAVVISLLLAFLCGFWVRQAEIVVMACQITEAVPAIPGTTALVVLLVVNVVLRRIPRIRPFSTCELVMIFLFVAVSTTMMGCGIGRFLISCTTVPFYYSSPDAPLLELAQHIPSWMAPADPTIHRWLYESSPTGHVPWDVWAVPIAGWTGFFVLFGGTLLCLMILFSEPWIEEERLVFPLVRLPLQMVGQSRNNGSFFKLRATWVGIISAVVLNVINMVRGVFFGGPSRGLRVNLGESFKGPPWNALRPFQMVIRPELVGLGYLISTGLSFSIWFFHIFHKLQALFMSGVGYRVSGAPFAQEQGIGAYVVLGLVLLWKAKHIFRSAWQAWLEGFGLTDSRMNTYRWALLGLFCGFAGVIVFCVAAGMELWLALLYFTILILVSITYGRLRAETGVPLIWAFPYGLAHKSIRYFLGSRPWIGAGNVLRSPTIYTLFIFLSRGYFPSTSGYGIEGMTLGERTGASKGSTFALTLLAIAFGTIISYYFHLTPYYEEGGVGLRGGIWGAGTARNAYASMYRSAVLPKSPEVSRIIATVGGGGFIAFLAFMRMRFFNWPFHPMGYAMACSYGRLLWANFLIVWIVKSVLLHYGGHQAYLAALPGFLGFALGHFIVAGAIWGSLGAWLGGKFLHYGVIFG